MKKTRLRQVQKATLIIANDCNGSLARILQPPANVRGVSPEFGLGQRRRCLRLHLHSRQAARNLAIAVLHRGRWIAPAPLLVAHAAFGQGRHQVAPEVRLVALLAASHLLNEGRPMVVCRERHIKRNEVRRVAGHD
jgi:hypothetical protein